jgi:hypothetical protein
MAFKLNINTDAVVKYTNKLEKIQKSALPIAIRSTLNDAVFDVKTRTMPASAKTEFEQRRKNFFTANSKFDPAKGLSINSMKATVGFYENKLIDQSTNYSVKDLEQQERGGKIDGKSFIPMSPSRIGGTGNVRPNARLKAIKEKNIVVSRNLSKGKSKAEKFILAIYKAGPGGYVLGGDTRGENILWRVNSLSSVLKTKKLDITPLYDYVKGRSIKVNKTDFMKEASLKTAKRLPEFYIKNAQKQLKKHYDK